MAVGILVFGIVAETISPRACLHEVSKVRNGRTLWRWFRESRQSELVDAIGSMSIGALLIVAAGIGVEIKALLIGQSAEARLREFLLKQDGVEKVYRLITLQLGTSLMVAVKARMKATTLNEAVAAINRAEAVLRAEFPEIQWLFFEPDTAD